MKKKKLIVFLIILIIVFAAGYFLMQKNKVSASKIQVIPVAKLGWGNGDNELGLKGPYQKMFYEGPGTFDVDKNGDVYIVDQIKKRIVKVENNSIVKVISIKPLFERNSQILPKRLVVENSCMYMLFAVLPKMEYSLSIIKENGIKVIDVNDFFKGIYVTGFNVKRLKNDSIAVMPDSPQKNISPMAIIVNPSGKVLPINELKNGSFDGITPYLKIIRADNKFFSKGIKIEIHDPLSNKTFTSDYLKNGENGGPIAIPVAELNFKRGAIHYITANREKSGIITSYVLYFDPSLKHIQKCIMQVNKSQQKNLLPLSFSVGKTEVLGEDGFLYDMNYTKEGYIISKLYCPAH
jgi:hypothetical protein